MLGKGACFPRPVPLLHLSFPAVRQRAALDLIQVARLWLWLWSQQFVCGLCSSCTALRPGQPPRVAAGAGPLLQVQSCAWHWSVQGGQARGWPQGQGLCSEGQCLGGQAPVPLARSWAPGRGMRPG